MNIKDFVFPGVVLGLVIIIALGLLVTHSSSPTTLLPEGSFATSTATSTPTTGSGSTSSGTGSTHTGGTGPVAYYPYGTLTLSLNQAAGFKDGLSIRPVAVTEDSRCPAGVMCIQAGTVRISLKTDVNGKEATHSLELGKSIIVGADTITFTEVAPIRSKDAAPTSSQYRFTFTVTHGGTASVGQCYVGGCSSEVCSDTPGAVSTCIYTPSYACYKTARCERQSNGSCGWTQTAELKSCLANPPAMR